MISGEKFIFTLKIFFANNCRFFWWMVNELSFTSKAENLIGILDKLYKGPFPGCDWRYFLDFYYDTSKLFDNT